MKKQMMNLERGNIRRAFTYLESGAVLLVTTNDGNDDNVMTISWQMVMDFIPHIAISTGAWNESFAAILKSRECCICIPTFDMLDAVVGIGIVHGSECNKFEQFHLSKLPANRVKAPLIAESMAAIECVLEDYAQQHGLLIFRGVQLWENKSKEDMRLIHANGDGTFFADGEFRNLREQMHKWVPEGSERF